MTRSAVGDIHGGAKWPVVYSFTFAGDSAHLTRIKDINYDSIFY